MRFLVSIEGCRRFVHIKWRCKTRIGRTTENDNEITKQNGGTMLVYSRLYNASYKRLRKESVGSDGEAGTEREFLILTSKKEIEIYIFIIITIKLYY